MTRRGLLFFLFAASLQGGETKLRPGFEEFFNLDYDGALKIFRVQALATPEDPTAWNEVAQAILYRDMFRVGALESQFVTGNNSFLRLPKMNPSDADQQEFGSAIEKALTISENRVKKNPKDEQALYAAGIAHGLRGNYNYLVRKAWLEALKDANAARKYHQDLLKINPAFTDAKLIIGVHDYLAGSLPRFYRIMASMAGVHGDRKVGIEELEDVARNGSNNRWDAKVILAAFYRREKRQAEALTLLKELLERFPRNFLFRLETAQMHADLGAKTAALDSIEEIRRLKREGTKGFDKISFEKIDYFEGNLLFWYDDLDASLKKLQSATGNTAALDPNSGVLAYMRQGQIYDLRGERDRAKREYRLAIDYAPQSDAAKECKEYLDAAYKRRAKA